MLSFNKKEPHLTQQQLWAAHPHPVLKGLPWRAHSPDFLVFSLYLLGLCFVSFFSSSLAKSWNSGLLHSIFFLDKHSYMFCLYGYESSTVHNWISNFASDLQTKYSSVYKTFHLDVSEVSTLNVLSSADASQELEIIPALMYVIINVSHRLVSPSKAKVRFSLFTIANS